jgi:hypothetical protein
MLFATGHGLAKWHTRREAGPQNHGSPVKDDRRVTETVSGSGDDGEYHPRLMLVFNA